MTNLSKQAAFNASVELSERLEKQQYRMELVLRFIVFSRLTELTFQHKDLGEFLNAENRALAADDAFDEKAMTRTFASTFGLIDAALGSDAFRRFDTTKKEFRGPFIISAFEAVALGVAHNISAWKKTPNAEAKLADKVKKLWSKHDFTDWVGPGSGARERIQVSVPFGRAHFKP
ncbi:MAG: hypothetical protein DI536_26035 [Archangium gephyra]|uniref:Uncharacterized protein n=1 Tax=Archangium gephyra TaxID=48 RepID=A0A2W5T718_9BACT|nr:MAG: hypothetical protein DI536_26035 [Archangium gephyra]